MKKLLDIVRKAMEVKKDFQYTHGQLQILEYIINENREPEDMKKELMDMYESSIEYFQDWVSDKEESEIKEQDLRGAADMLAWLLDIPQKEHKKNMKKIDIEK